MPGRLEGKIAVITGGDGIARAAALRFAAEGAKVVGADLAEEKVAETARLVAKAGGEMVALGVDLMDEAAVNGLMKFAEQTYGGIDVLAHFAMDLRVGELESETVENFSYTLTHTATMTFLVSKHAVPFMIARGGGAMVLAGSQSGSLGTGFLGNTGHLFSYAVGKGAVIRMGVVLANVLGRHGIRVNIVSPGPVATPNAVALFGADGTSERKLLVDDHMLLGRISYPDDIASAAVFLASDEASNITGHNLFVDGGMTASGGMGLRNEEVQKFYDAIIPPPQAEEQWLRPA
ncbi:MAG: SDR family oxidoreductase [Sphingobium sp.]|uniref:SDR family NAD(P)-dependent oxidoreductase n=1 Tax=Sphingobium sp. TaxID=1912891 RepID=UPI0029B81A18|nr:SDR family oxidoreductase [Sphingobium sp.]MDX3910594.1 SDR family oxidoreductase [Sphingobium sp.]